MNLKRNSMTQNDKIIFILTVFLLSCFMIFEKYTWGKYALFIASLLIFLLDMFTHSQKLELRLGLFHKYFFAFVLFCFASSIWALSSELALERSFSLLNNLICITLIFPYYSRKKDISMLLSVIIYSGFIISLYTIYYYGISTLLASTSLTRLGNDYSNINTVGMFCAFSLVFQFEKWIYEKKFNWKLLFVIPAIIVVAATQSRKAFLLLFLGTIMIAALKDSASKNIIKIWKNYFTIAIVVGLVLVFASNLALFSGITERFSQLMPLITGSGDIDSGSIKRQNYLNLGIQIWLQSPFYGIGINCPRIINDRVLGQFTYLHNNYVELLSGVGIIGFLIYYYMFYYLIKTFLKFKHNNYRQFSLGITWVILLLVIDYGMVSYYSKIQCFYLMVIFLNAYFLIKYPVPKSLSLDSKNNS